MQNKMAEAEAVLVVVLVHRGNINKELIIDVIAQFTSVYKFSYEEGQKLLQLLVDRFIHTDKE